jgi:protein-S-isoprenylcysteine O-methyltransferase Ste14
MADMTRVPALGPRGEGWVIIQVILLGLTALAGLAGPAWGGIARIVSSAAGAALLLGGLTLALWGGRSLRTALTPFPRPLADAPLVDGGAYGVVRHPIYGGIVLGAAGWALLTAAPAGFAGAAALLVLFDLKSRREEAWLVELHPSYEGYRQRVRKLIPWIY